MLIYREPLDWLPTAEDLPDSDETPVDHELQEILPNLLKYILATLWADRSDWLFSIQMGVHYNPDFLPAVPDAFLRLGVETMKTEDLRSSYVLWDENGTMPQFVLEVVSQTYRSEYNLKKDLYESLGVLYYVIYNPIRKRKPSLEVYRLTNEKYSIIIGGPIWMPELGLGIGVEDYTHHGKHREWVFWYDENGKRYPTPQEIADQAKQQTQEINRQLQSEQERSQRLSDRLRSLGINSDDL